MVGKRRRTKAWKAGDNYKLTLLAYQERAFWFRKGAELGLYRTFAVPSISKVLMASREMEDHCNKRYDDTDILITETFVSPPDSERWKLACARINQIHGMYSNSISRDQMVYVLSCLLVQPVTIINAYAARGLDQREVAAMVATTNEFGRGLGLTDLPQTYQDWVAMQRAYEDQHYKYAPSNKVISDVNTVLFLSHYPRWLHGEAQRTISALCDKPLRDALGLPKVSWVRTASLRSLLWVRKMVCRAVLPPILHWSGRLVLGGCPAVGQKLALRWHPYGVTLPEGYEIEAVGPTKCPVLSRPELLAQWGKGGVYVEDLKGLTGATATLAAQGEGGEGKEGDARATPALVDSAVALNVA